MKNRTARPPGGDRHGDPLANAFRRWGYLQARLDALERLGEFHHPDISDAVASAPAADVQLWREVYCGAIGVEFMHLIDRRRARWVADWMEAPADPPDLQRILKQLAATELFERFLHARYVGSKRYSIEGVAGVVPLLAGIFDVFADGGGECAVIAMSHRGRLNVMANIVGIPGAEIFAEQEDVDPKSVLGSGDVKYHLGATGEFEAASGRRLAVHLASNPSHLEAVGPVVAGRVRAKQDRIGEGARGKILPVTLHGDAAFAGQGITAETLNLSGLPGYSVGGTIRVIVNNLVGFTARPGALHSSRFSSDLGKRLSIPIIHVNGEEPGALARAGRMATEYRTAFGDDVIIDLIGYRRYGHSEVEDPSTTQPLLYARIKDRPMLWELCADRIGVGGDEREALRKRIWERLVREQEAGRSIDERPTMRTMPSYWDGYRGGPDDTATPVDTVVPRDRLLAIAEAMATTPDGFHVHPKVARVLERRVDMVRGDRAVDWATAESLAFGSLLAEGVPVRLAGQDSRRGTFNQRHAVLIDVTDESEYTPLAHLAPDQGRFTVLDSPLSEAAALGYEYGYSRDYPDALVCWEAQFGDFANGAQTIIDQFLAAGEDKWGLLSGLVVLLPHGYEGQGPEHSSARLERFLQLAAEDNMQVCQPATSCQYFHLLRRQALQEWRKPLVMLTPKGLLRAEAASSPIDAFTANRCFRLVLPDTKIEDARRVLVCSGKIVHDLRKERDLQGETATAVISLSQLYPFPERELEAELARHRSAGKVVWVQEEPANMGALAYVRPHLQRVLGDRHLTTIKRSASASPATGSSKAHNLEQQALIRLAFA
ncbi:MAG: 2-oxoglutarate dehydrogenase E1 component [Candidatus Krumholzibacteriia bacterium]